MNDRFRGLAAVTTGLTFVLILLGLHTGNTAGGLSCGTQWPLCNGFLGLFPANWASFFEWFHRLVAMVVGILLLGTLYGAWRWQADRRVAYAVTLAVAVLPVQILLGGVTTTAGGLFPDGFNPVVMLAHFTTATAIFGLLVYGTARAVRPVADRVVRQLAGSALAFLAVHLVFDVLSVFAYEPANQAGYYAGSFALFASLVGLLVVGRGPVPNATLARFRALVGLAAGAVFVDMVLSRRLLGVPTTVGGLTTLLVAVLVVGVAVLVTRTVAGAPPGTSRRAG